MDHSGIYHNEQTPSGNPGKTKGWKKDCEHIYETEDFSRGPNTPEAVLSGNVAHSFSHTHDGMLSVSLWKSMCIL